MPCQWLPRSPSCQAWAQSCYNGSFKFFTAESMPLFLMLELHGSPCYWSNSRGTCRCFSLHTWLYKTIREIVCCAASSLDSSATHPSPSTGKHRSRVTRDRDGKQEWHNHWTRGPEPQSPWDLVSLHDYFRPPTRYGRSKFSAWPARPPGLHVFLHVKKHMEFSLIATISRLIFFNKHN